MAADSTRVQDLDGLDATTDHELLEATPDDLDFR
jgi:hypothetical protein